MPLPYEGRSAPANESPLERGEYLAELAGCHHCHTPFKNGKYDEAYAFAGGHRLVYGETNEISPNITMDKETGLGAWTAESFIATFRSHGTEAGRSKGTPAEGPTIMPWASFAEMTDEDLRAIWEYLETQPVIRNDSEGSGM